MPYVDGFLFPLPKRNLAAYRRMASAAGRIFRKHGALQFRESVGDDLNVPGMRPFPLAVRCRRGETVLFSYIVFRSRAHRDRVNAKVMQDPAILKMLTGKLPFDARRMFGGGFRVLVEA